MKKEELKTLFANIMNAAAGVTGAAQNHLIALAIMQDCEKALKELENDDKHTDNA